MGFPAIRVRAFPGKREEANRAGITPKIRVGTIDLSIARVGQAIVFNGLPFQATLHWKWMPVERSFSVNGVDVAVWEWTGEDPPVMFCHATGFHSRCWDQVKAQLPGRHCYALD